MDETTYKYLVESIYCCLLVFNKRKVRELQRITLDTYVKHLDTKPVTEFKKLLIKIKKNSCQRKTHRGVPVLVDKITQEGIDHSIELKNNFFPTYNSYLFGLVDKEN